MWLPACMLSMLALLAPQDPAPNPDLAAVLDQDSKARDLAELRRVIDHEWLLSNATPADHDEAIAGLAAAEGMTVAELALGIQRLLALGADGHAISGWMFPAMLHISARELPFTLEVVDGRYVAIDPSSKRRNQLWDADHPYVVAIDGIPVERWVGAAMPLVPRTNDLAMNARACHLIRYAGYFRTLLGIPDAPAFAVDLESAGGERVSLRVDDSGTFKESHFKYNLYLREAEAARITEANLGYLRFHGAPDELGRLLVEGMPKLRHTRGLVIDLRGNDGGAGETLNLLGIWLAGGPSPRHFAGVERKPTGDPLIANFFTMDASSAGLSAEGRELVGEWLGGFRSAWSAPAAIPTTDRCVLLASPAAEPGMPPHDHPDFDRMIPPSSIYHYDKPVVLLVDRHCFSGAELIAAGLRGLPNVTIAGERTRGGAGSPQSFRLPASGLHIDVSARAVFLPPDGRLIDGSGVVPDVEIGLDLGTITGPGDPMLDRAFGEVEAVLAAP